MEINSYPHSLSRCQLNLPTNCSKCSRFIPGLYKQGYRCHKCFMVYHRHCTPFLLDDCPVRAHDGASPKTKNFLLQLTFINPLSANSTSTPTGTPHPQTTRVPFYRMSIGPSSRSTQSTSPNTIIEKGIFPACLRGQFYRRYLFRLTIYTLSISTNLLAKNVAETHLPESSDTDMNLLLTDIQDLILTHFMHDRDGVFEILLKDRTVISVGKKCDSDNLQMDAAVFYSSIRDQRETLINKMPPPTALPPPIHPMGIEVSKSKKLEDLPVLFRKHSRYQRPPYEKENSDKDLHEVYSFTGEKLGEGMWICRCAYLYYS